METKALGAPWGTHLVLDISKCDKSKATNPEYITKFAKALVEKIDMIPYGEPQVVHFCDHVAEKAGWTLVQLIETSNIMGHFCDADGDCYLDIFSCKHFDIDETIKFIQEWFSPARIDYVVFDRNAGYQQPINKMGTELKP